jgi:serine/threonine-protein phosphatase 6 regulatory ankyrin repeat subunit B
MDLFSLLQATARVREYDTIRATRHRESTALHHAAEHGREETATLLLSQGAKVDIKDQDGMTPLMAAAAGGHLGVVKIILQHLGGKGLDRRGNKGRTALIYASGKGHEDTVAFLLNKGAKVDIKKRRGINPLMAAASGGHVGVVKMLLQHMGGKGLDQTDKEGRTALCHASEQGHEEIVVFLMSQGAQVDIKTRRRMTPLMAAASGGHVGLMKLLLQHMGGPELGNRDYVGRTALYFASEQGHEEMVTFLLSQGAQVEIRGPVGDTPLMAAAAYGHMRVVKMLLQHMGGQGLEEADYEGRTVLCWAAQKGREEMVTFLMSQGAEADITNQYGETPFMLGAVGGHLGVVKMLLHHMGGQGLDQTDYEGRTALCCAAIIGHAEMVAFLLSQGGQVDIRDHGGWTPLMAAAWSGQLVVVKMLLQHMGGQGLNETDNEGKTALCHAAWEGHEECSSLFKEMVAFLLSQGAKVDITDKDGGTPLRVAAFFGHVGVVKMLLQHVGGQGLSETDNEGRTTLYYAALRGHEEIVRALLIAGADPIITDRKGRTPLAIAQEEGRQGCVEVFNVSMQESMFAIHSRIPIDMRVPHSTPGWVE